MVSKSIPMSATRLVIRNVDPRIVELIVNLLLPAWQRETECVVDRWPAAAGVENLIFTFNPSVKLIDARYMFHRLVKSANQAVMIDESIDFADASAMVSALEYELYGRVDMNSHDALKLTAKTGDDIEVSELAAPTIFVLTHVELVGFGMIAMARIDSKLAELLGVEGTQYPWGFNQGLFTLEKRYQLSAGQMADFATQILNEAVAAEPFSRSEAPRKVILRVYDKAQATDKRPDTVCEVIEGDIFNPLQVGVLVSDQRPDELISTLNRLIATALSCELDVSARDYPGYQMLLFNPDDEVGALPRTELQRLVENILSVAMTADPIRAEENDGTPDKAVRRVIISGGDKRARNWARDHANVEHSHVLNRTPDA